MPPRDSLPRRPRSERRPEGRPEVPRRVRGSNSPPHEARQRVSGGERGPRRFDDDNLYRVTENSNFAHCVKIVKKILHEGPNDVARLKSSSKTGS